MSFVEDLKNYLLRLNEPALSDPAGPPQVSVSPDWVRAELIQLFERLEKSSAKTLSTVELTKQFYHWTTNDNAVRFATALSSRASFEVLIVKKWSSTFDWR